MKDTVSKIKVDSVLNNTWVCPLPSTCTKHTDMCTCVHTSTCTHTHTHSYTGRVGMLCGQAESKLNVHTLARPISTGPSLTCLPFVENSSHNCSLRNSAVQDMCGQPSVEIGKKMYWNRTLEQAIPDILIVKQLWLGSTALGTEEVALWIKPV